MDIELTKEEAPRYHEWRTMDVNGSWEDGIPEWAKDRQGRADGVTALRSVNRELVGLAFAGRIASFPKRAARWAIDCMGAALARRKIVRVRRFFEEACELAQSLGMPANEAVQLVGYVWSRPIGEPFQEAGATALTLALLCHAHDMDMFAAAEKELARVSEPALFERIRAKALAAPLDSPLPVAVSATGQPSAEFSALAQALAERDALRVEMDRALCR